MKKLKSSDGSYKKIEFKPGNFIKQTISVQVEGGKVKLPPIQLNLSGNKKSTGHRKGKSMEDTTLDVHKSYDSMEKDQSALHGNHAKQNKLNESFSPTRDGVAMRKFIIDLMDKSLGIKKRNHFKYEAKFEDPGFSDGMNDKKVKKLNKGEKEMESKREELKRGNKFKENTKDEKNMQDGKDEEIKHERDASKSDLKGKETRDEFREFLASGYMNYNNDLENRLRVQKIVTNHHRYERKMTLINFPPVKKINSESN